jgi:hypothetical protein
MSINTISAILLDDKRIKGRIADKASGDENGLPYYHCLLVPTPRARRPVGQAAGDRAGREGR